eukprot:2442612-Prymnesium_polylepis.2
MHQPPYNSVILSLRHMDYSTAQHIKPTTERIRLDGCSARARHASVAFGAILGGAQSQSCCEGGQCAPVTNACDARPASSPPVPARAQVPIATRLLLLCVPCGKSSQDGETDIFDAWLLHRCANRRNDICFCAPP